MGKKWARLFYLVCQWGRNSCKKYTHIPNLFQFYLKTNVLLEAEIDWLGQGQAFHFAWHRNSLLEAAAEGKFRYTSIWLLLLSAGHWAAEMKGMAGCSPSQLHALVENSLGPILRKRLPLGNTCSIISDSNQGLIWNKFTVFFFFQDHISINFSLLVRFHFLSSTLG